MNTHPETVPIRHPFVAADTTLPVPWWLFERLVALGYLDLAPIILEWRVSFDGLTFMERARREDDRGVSDG